MVPVTTTCPYDANSLRSRPVRGCGPARTARSERSQLHVGRVLLPNGERLVCEISRSRYKHSEVIQAKRDSRGDWFLPHPIPGNLAGTDTNCYAMSLSHQMIQFALAPWLRSPHGCVTTILCPDEWRRSTEKKSNATSSHRGRSCPRADIRFSPHAGTEWIAPSSITLSSLTAVAIYSPSGGIMRKTILYCAVVTGFVGLCVALSPTPAQAEAPNNWVCVGGCDNYVYLNPCPNGFCSLFCTVNPT